jgi:hypothetical protein
MPPSCCCSSSSAGDVLAARRERNLLRCWRKESVLPMNLNAQRLEFINGRSVLFAVFAPHSDMLLFGRSTRLRR